MTNLTKADRLYWITVVATVLLLTLIPGGIILATGKALITTGSLLHRACGAAQAVLAGVCGICLSISANNTRAPTTWSGIAVALVLAAVLVFYALSILWPLAMVWIAGMVVILILV